MLKSILVMAALAITPAAFGQETAAVDPAAPLPAIEPVVGQCEIVAAADDGDTSASGLCIGATQGFLAGLGAGEPAAVDARITELVLALVPLVDDEICNDADGEVAEAIRLAAARLSDPEQRVRLVDIADTVAACDGAQTAAIVPDPVPASAG